MNITVAQAWPVSTTGHCFPLPHTEEQPNVAVHNHGPAPVHIRLVVSPEDETSSAAEAIPAGKTLERAIGKNQYLIVRAMPPDSMSAWAMVVISTGTGIHVGR